MRREPIKGRPMAREDRACQVLRQEGSSKTPRTNRPLLAVCLLTRQTEDALSLPLLLVLQASCRFHGPLLADRPAEQGAFRPFLWFSRLTARAHSKTWPRISETAPLQRRPPQRRMRSRLGSPFPLCPPSRRGQSKNGFRFARSPLTGMPLFQSARPVNLDKQDSPGAASPDPAVMPEHLRTSRPFAVVGCSCENPFLRCALPAKAVASTNSRKLH